MPQVNIDDPQYVEQQYRDSSNLAARIALHQRFGTNQYNWQRWVFDQFSLPSKCRILELGCGSGTLWLENLGWVPAGWEMILSDLSAGMVEKARQNLGVHSRFQFKVMDGRSIPSENESFDAVIANHIFQHIPDKAAALAEIRRILKPGGKFYTSTIGERHLSEISDLLAKFDPELASWASWRDQPDAFTLEKGETQLLPWFSDVRLSRYENALDVTEVAPLLDYILSGRVELSAPGREQFRDFLDREMDSQGGIIHITLDSGLFTAVRIER